MNLTSRLTDELVNGVGNRLLRFALDYLNNGYGGMLNVYTWCHSCDYDSEHWTVKPLFFGPLFKEPTTVTIDKALDYYVDRIFLMQKHANETGHLCQAYIYYFNVRLDIKPNIWSRLIRAMLILRGLKYDATGRLVKL